MGAYFQRWAAAKTDRSKVLRGWDSSTSTWVTEPSVPTLRRTRTCPFNIPLRSASAGKEGWSRESRCKPAAGVAAAAIGVGAAVATSSAAGSARDGAVAGEAELDVCVPAAATGLGAGPAGGIAPPVEDGAVAIALIDTGAVEGAETGIIVTVECASDKAAWEFAIGEAGLTTAELAALAAAWARRLAFASPFGSAFADLSDLSAFSGLICSHLRTSCDTSFGFSAMLEDASAAVAVAGDAPATSVLLDGVSVFAAGVGEAAEADEAVEADQPECAVFVTPTGSWRSQPDTSTTDGMQHANAIACTTYRTRFPAFATTIFVLPVGSNDSQLAAGRCARTRYSVLSTLAGQGLGPCGNIILHCYALLATLELSIRE